MGERPGVAVVIDGVPVFERTGRVNIDLDNIESIKVIKGGASYLFGDDALSGAVIITTKRGANYDNIHLSGEVGSFDYRKALARTGFAGMSPTSQSRNGGSSIWVVEAVSRNAANALASNDANDRSGGAKTAPTSALNVTRATKMARVRPPI